jgi:hypothetical protein
MAKFIKLEDWSWLNIDKIEQMFAEMSMWQDGKMTYAESKIHAITEGGTHFAILDITSAGVVPEGEKWMVSDGLEVKANLELAGIVEWLATIAANPEKTVAKVPGDMRMDLIVAMNAIVNNTTAEGAEECE